MHGGSNRSESDGAATRPNISLAARQWLTPHGMGTTDHSGKLGAGGEFAQQATQWMTPSVVSATGQEYTRDGGIKGQERLALPGQAKQAMGLWLTPNVPNGGRSVSAEMVASHGMTEDGEKRTVGLESQTRHWPSPRATDGTKGGPNQSGSKGDLMLPSAAAQWPTPASRDYRSPNAESYEARGGGMKGEQLNNFVAHSPCSPQAQPIPDGQESSPSDPTSRQRLNPAFGCWLMGWPVWWTNPAITNCARSEMESYRFALRSHLSSLLGEPGSTERKAA
jgi:hypothetical protein